MNARTISVDVGISLGERVWVRLGGGTATLCFGSIDEAQKTLRAAANQLDLLRIPPD